MVCFLVLPQFSLSLYFLQRILTRGVEYLRNAISEKQVRCRHLHVVVLIRLKDR